MSKMTGVVRSRWAPRASQRWDRAVETLMGHAGACVGTPICHPPQNSQAERLPRQYHRPFAADRPLQSAELGAANASRRPNDGNLR
jgi:hypothetical protein